MGTLPFLATLFQLYIHVGASDLCPIVLANVLFTQNVIKYLIEYGKNTFWIVSVLMFI